MGSSIHKTGGVAEILKVVRDEATDEMRKRLVERSKSVDLYTEVEIDHLSRLCGTIARNAAANGVAQSYQFGVNRAATAEDFERDTELRKK